MMRVGVKTKRWLFVEQCQTKSDWLGSYWSLNTFFFLKIVLQGECGQSVNVQVTQVLMLTRGHNPEKTL